MAYCCVIPSAFHEWSSPFSALSLRPLSLSLSLSLPALFSSPLFTSLPSQSFYLAEYRWMKPFYVVMSVCWEWWRTGCRNCSEVRVSQRFTTFLLQVGVGERHFHSAVHNTENVFRNGANRKVFLRAVLRKRCTDDQGTEKSRRWWEARRRQGEARRGDGEVMKAREYCSHLLQCTDTVRVSLTELRRWLQLFCASVFCKSSFKFLYYSKNTY